ncbi:Pif-4 [Phenacoccus solenopsis nudivirus]|nr:Pif-4 [Phenacoccus solenopsis nudivirus]
MDTVKVVYVVLMIFIIGYILFYAVLANSRLLPLRDIVKRAFDESDLKQTEYWIYDKTVDADCDRLIIVKPFDWYLLNVNRQLFVLEPERPINCTPSQMSALRILRSSFIECCLGVNLETLLASYVQPNIVPFVRVPYTIKADRFTVLTAINELCKKYIDFEPDIKNSVALGHVENIYSLHNRGFNMSMSMYANNTEKTTTMRPIEEVVVNETRNRRSPQAYEKSIVTQYLPLPSEKEMESIRIMLHNIPTDDERAIHEYHVRESAQPRPSVVYVGKSYEQLQALAKISSTTITPTTTITRESA